MEAVVKAIDSVLTTPEDMKGLVLTSPSIAAMAQGGRGTPTQLAELAASFLRGGGATGGAATGGAATAIPPRAGAQFTGAAASHGGHAFAPAFLGLGADEPSSTPLDAASAEAAASGLLELARQVETVRFEELLEWYMAETENNLSAARLLVGRFDTESKAISLELANSRNRCVGG